MSPIPTPVNYAEQVLLEEAERHRLLNSKKQQSVAEAAAATVKLNLADEETFPSLGSAIAARKPVAWGSSTGDSIKAPPPSLLNDATKSAPTSSSSIVSKAFQLPVEQQRRSISSFPLPQVLENVMKETGATVEASTSGQTKAISFVIRGKVSAVLQAKRILWSQLAQNGSIEFEVPEECLGFIIGPGGKKLQALQSEFAVKISIPKGDDWQGRIMVTGDFEGVAMARDRILGIVNERTNKLTLQLEMPAHLGRFLWSTSVSGLSESSLPASLKSSLYRSFSPDKPSVLNVSGDRDACATLQQQVSEALVRLRLSIKSVSTTLPKSLHRLICGPKMSKLTELEELTGCAISVPSAEDQNNENITIYGPEDKLLKGFAVVMEQTADMCSQSISIPSDGVIVLLQKHAKYRTELKQAEREFGVNVHFSPLTRTLSVDGHREAVLAAWKSLNAQIESLASRFSLVECLSLDQAYLKHVIGRKGHVIQQIQKDFQVEVTVDSDDQEVYLWGTVKSIAAAKQHISQLLTAVIDLTTISAKIDAKYHGLLIGAKGSNLAAYQERFPSVMVTFPEEGSGDLVEFKGPRDEAEAFKAELVAKAEAIRHEMVMNSYIQTLKVEQKVLQSAKNRARLSALAREDNVKLQFKIEAGELAVQGNKKAVDAAVAKLSSEAKTLAERDVLAFSVDPQYHSILIGKQGRNLKHLASKYGVNVRFPSSSTESRDDSDAESVEQSTSSNNTNSIKIIGPRSNLTQARDELLDLLKYHLENSHREVMQVPAQQIGHIIGKNGRRAMELEVSCDCKIQYEKSGDLTEISFTGSKVNIAKAQAEIKAILEELERTDEVTIECPTELLSTYRFAYRKWSSSLEHCNVHVHGSKVNIRGPKEAVSNAVDALNSLIAEVSNYKYASLPQIKQQSYGKLLGPSGATIKRLSHQFNVDIQVPRLGEDSKHICIVGSAEQVDAAVEEILKICASGEKVFKFDSKRQKDAALASLDDALKSTGVSIRDHPAGVGLSGSEEQIEAAFSLLSTKKQ